MSTRGKRMTPLMPQAVRLLAVLLAVALLGPQPFTLAQAVPGESPARSSVLPTGGGQALLDPSDTVILLLDHQAGLFQTVKDISVAELRANTTLLAKVATLLKIPVITTASEPNGPNGPLMPEIHHAAPHAVYVPRKGEVNAWDNDDFVETVRATGKQDADHGGGLDQRLRDVPGARCQGGGVHGVCGDRCLRRPERVGVAHHARAPGPGRRHPYVGECRPLRGAPHVEPS